MADELGMSVEDMIISKDSFTENMGRDNKLYYWYFNGEKEVIYCADDGRKVDSDAEIDKLFL